MMTPVRRLPRVVLATTLLSAVLLLATLATVRPAAAGDEWATYSMTYRGTAVGREGLVGASGGLVAFSGGPGAVVGRLDAAPSGSAEASSIEPGTMARLIGGQVNGAAPQEVVGEPLTARAEFPGDASEDSSTQGGPQDAGPMRITGAEAEAVVSASASRAAASVARFRVSGGAEGAAAFSQAATAWRTTWVDSDAGLAAAQQPRAATDDVLVVEGAFGRGTAVADLPARSLTSTTEVGAQRVVVQGALAIEGVVGRAVAGAVGTDRTTTATMEVGQVTVAGAPVTLDENGISVTENQVVAGADVAAANAALNEVLAGAGISVRLLDPTETTDDRAARATSGGVAVEVVTASTDSVPRNTLTIVVGRGQAALTADPASPPPPPLTGAAPVPTTPVPAVPPATDGGASLAVPTTPAGGAAPEPGIAAPAAEPTELPTQVVAAGMTLSARTAFAGFAAWMLFTFSLPLLGSALLGRRA